MPTETRWRPESELTTGHDLTAAERKLVKKARAAGERVRKSDRVPYRSPSGEDFTYIIQKVDDSPVLAAGNDAGELSKRYAKRRSRRAKPHPE